MRRGWKRGAGGARSRVRARDVALADEKLLRVLEADFEEAARRAKAWLVCRPGCSDCCIGPFPITRLDVGRLRRGLARLKVEDPMRADAIAARAGVAVAALEAGYPGDAGSGRLVAGEAQLDRFFERHAGLACPALDRAVGRCDLYSWRPVSCRTYGPPLRFGDQAAPPCDLCFDGATTEIVEACRIAPDRDSLEESILAAIGVGDGEDWETLIAFALADERATF